MTMDMLRSGYRTKMRFWRGSNSEVEVRWFRCDPSALWFPGAHVFASDNWRPERVEHPLGEVNPGKRPYDIGTNPLGYMGKNFCGRIEDFANGGDFGQSKLIITDGEGWALCCKRVKLRARGGVAVGGTAFDMAHLLVASGGVALGGSAGFSSSSTLLATGGVSLGGTVWPGLWGSEGGEELGGAAAFSRGAVLRASGGLEMGATAQQGPAKEASVRGYTYKEEAAVANTITIDAPLGLTAGDVLVLAVHMNTNGPTVTPPAGFTSTFLGLVTTQRWLWVGWKLAGGSEPPNYTLTFTAGGGSAGIMVAVQGSSGSPVVGVATAFNGTAPNTPSLFLGGGPGCAVGVLDTSPYVVVTQPAGWDLLQNLSPSETSFGIALAVKNGLPAGVNGPFVWALAASRIGYTQALGFVPP